MEEDSLIIQQTNKMIKAKRRVLITNIILIVIILAIAFYVIYNLEPIKDISKDVCKLCQEQIKMICYFPTNYLPIK